MKNNFLGIKNTFLFLALACISCNSTSQPTASTKSLPIEVGSMQTETYFPFLKGKKIAIVGNPTSVIPSSSGEYVHIVDSLLAAKIEIVKVFAPEHGFRGEADAGEYVKDGLDTKTKLPIISLYGNHKKPTPQELREVDYVVFDMQDVGARFYTYISTLHYVMEACAENQIPLLVLDRPNPNGHYIDGPVLEPAYTSFVGMHPVPVVHGLTIGEYAQLINGEGYLANGIKAPLKVIPMKNYTKNKTYDVPIKPSPNLPNEQAINLYPSLCFFEGTTINAGRGTDLPFQVYGSPDLPLEVYSYSYVPQPNEGSKNPKHQGQLCIGENLSNHPRLSSLSLEWLINAYAHSSQKDTFFNSFFNKLAGNASLQKAIKEGKSMEEIRASWQDDLAAYQKRIIPYLLYE